MVLGQKANVFACRSSTRWPGALGWSTNRLLLPAGAVELTFSFAALFVTPLALVLGQAAPPPAGWAVALSAPLLVLGVDAGRWGRPAYVVMIIANHILPAGSKIAPGTPHRNPLRAR